MAADPKYANLSGIAYDQPDVYETNDLPEADQFHDDQEEDSDSIEHLHVNVPEAFSRFKGTVLSSENVDFSDRLSRRTRTGYKARSGEWELVAAGEKESPIQRYNRLKCEMKELLEEISILKEGDTEGEGVAINTNVVEHVEGMLKKMEALRLEKSLGPAVVSQLSDPQGTQIKKLLISLEKLGSGGTEGDKDAAKDSSSKEMRGDPAEIRYKVGSNPASANLAQAARLADLEARVSKLHQLVSASPSALKRLGGSGDKSLAETAHWIAGKVALLEEAQLEAVEAKVTTLLGKLDQLADKSAHITGSHDNKISELYELVKTTEEMSLVIPTVLDRMLALEDLHRQGNDFSKSLNELGSMQKVLSNSCEQSKELLRRLEENFASNLNSLKGDIDTISGKIKKLSIEKPK